MADRGVTARALARQVLRRVEQGEAYAALALGGALSKSGLSAADRGLATELVYGVLRHRTRLDRALAARAPRGLGGLSPLVLVALRVAAYQLIFLRVPAHAAVDDAVAAVKAPAGPKVAGFANAILRKVATAGEPPPPADLEARLVELHSQPQWLARRLIDAVGDQAEAAAEAMNRPPPLSLRVSPRTTRDVVMARLALERPGAQLEPSPYLGEGLLSRSGGGMDDLSLFQEGLVTVQDSAAQLIGRLLGAAPGEHILDACAGVGGKSTHLAELAGDRAHIDAADLSRRKLDLAQDAARRLGLSSIRTVEADLTRADAPLAAAYHRVLLDAPCSGLGVLRRHPEGKWRRRPEEIGELAALQRRLLDAVAARVRPGGLLVYSVCTYTVEECESQVRRFLDAHPRFELAPIASPFIGADGYFRSWPHLHDTDGFFAARMRARS